MERLQLWSSDLKKLLAHASMKILRGNINKDSENTHNITELHRNYQHNRLTSFCSDKNTQHKKTYLTQSGFKKKKIFSMKF